MRNRTRGLCLALAGCLGVSIGAGQDAGGPAPAEVEACLSRVLDYHGHLGPWAVIGYRIGQRAMKETGAHRGAKELVIVHKCPNAVQYTCSLDGLHAATGASIGKLTLSHEVVPADRLCTEVNDRAHGKRLIFRMKPGLMSSILNLPPAGQVSEARRMAALPDTSIFEVETTTVAAEPAK